MLSIIQVFSFDMLAKLALGLAGILLIRFMPEPEYARYIFALACANLLTQTMTSAFNRIYIVGYKKFNLAEAAAPFLGLQLLILLAAAVLLFPMRIMLRGLYGLAAAFAAATCLVEFARTAFQQEMRFIRFSQVELCRAGCFLAGVLALAWLPGLVVSAWQVLALQVATLLLTFVLAFHKRRPFAGILRVREAMRLAGTVFGGIYKYLFGYFALLAVFGQMDVFMLRWLADDLTLATYGAAFRYYGLLLLSLGAVHAVLLPMIQKVESAEEFDRALRGLWRLLWFFIPAVALGAWAAGWIMPWIDKGKYPGAVPAFRVLCVSSVISFAFSPHVNLLMRFEDFRFLLVLLVLSMLVGFCVNYLLIPRLGATGSAFATLAAFGCLNGGTFLRARCWRAALSNEVCRPP